MDAVLTSADGQTRRLVPLTVTSHHGRVYIDATTVYLSLDATTARQLARDILTRTGGTIRP